MKIGDACNNTSDLVDGLAVQAYRSQRHRACVIPVGSGAPEIRTISVLEGSVDGGTQVVMTGRFLANAQSVSFGSVNAARFTVNSMTRITAVTPSFRAERQRIVDIAVRTSFGTGYGPNAFSFYPEVTGVSPDGGRMSGGKTVTVTGRGFITTGSTDVLFDIGSPSPNVSCRDESTCVVESPRHLPGRVPILVRVGGVLSKPGSVVYNFAPPTIDQMSRAEAGAARRSPQHVDMGRRHNRVAAAIVHVGCVVGIDGVQ